MSGSPPHIDNIPPDRTRTTVLDVHGRARLWHEGTEITLRPKERALLAALALVRPRAASHDEIVDMLWQHRPPPTARKSIHNHVSRLRQIVEGVIETSSGGYALADKVALVPWHEGVGEPFADLADTAAVTIARAHATAVAAAAEDAALETAVRNDRRDAVARLREALAEHPLDERKWWLLALQLARQGRRRDALLACNDARRHLAEAGLLPTEQLIALESLIVTGDPRLNTGEGITELLDAALGRAPAQPNSSRHHAIPIIHPHGDDPFVGRRAELDLLSAAWADACARGPVFAIVTGPSGMGKTRLVDYFVRGLHTREPDARVLLGRGRATADQAFGMLAESFTDLQTQGPDDGMATTRLARAVRARLDALLDVPTVWCVDDVQWVGADALGVLDAALDGMRGPLLVVATVRAGELAATGLLGMLAGKLAVRHIELAPLTVDDVGDLLAADGARQADRHVADVVHARTGGLALYASEIARAVRDSHGHIDPTAMPAALRDWISARRAALPTGTAALLDMAAVLGEHFDADLLARAVGDATAPDAQVARACDALIDAGLLRPLDSEPGGAVRLAFAHTITHEIVYSQIGPATRAQLHLLAAHTIEEVADRHGIRRDHAALAHHYVHAGVAGRVAAARESRLAGDAAYAMGAWGAAAAHYRTAFRTIDDGTARAELLVAVGRAELRAGQHEPAADTLRAAVELARTHGLALVEAQATLEMVGRAGRGAAVGAGDAEHERLLRRAIESLERHRPGDDDDERACTVALSALERELAFVLLLGDPTERTGLLSRALKRVRALDPPDEAAVANALLGARYAKLAGHQLGERLADIDEVLGAPRAQVGNAAVLAALSYRIEDLLRAGRIDEVADALADAEAMLRQHPDPYWRWAVRAWRAVHAIALGDLDEAEAIAEHAAALRPGVPEAAACLVVNRVNIGLYRGRSADFIDSLDAACERFPNVPAYRAVLTLCLSRAGTAGSEQRARAELTALARDGFASLPDDVNRFFALGVLAHAAADLGDRDAGSRLAPLLEPYRGQWVVVTAYGAGGAVWGPVDHARARLAELAGRAQLAGDLFGQAERQAALTPLVRSRIAADRAA